MRTLFVHIGLPKAGSTSLQHFFMTNRALLERQGVAYPAAGAYHHQVAQHVWARALKGPRYQYYWIEPDDARYHVDALQQELLDHIAASPCPTVMLSAEELWHPAIPPKLADAFADGPWTTKILIYARRQDHLLLSAYNQCVKTLDPRVVDREHVESLEVLVRDELASTRPFFALYPTLRDYAERFGRDNVLVRVLEREQLVNGDLFDDVLSVLGLRPDDRLERPKRLNASLPQQLIDVVDQLNRRSTLPRGPQLSFNYRLRHLAEMMPLQDYAPLSAARRREILARFEDDNARVAQEFLDRSDGRLFFEPWPDPNEAWAPPPALTPELMTRAVARLWEAEDARTRALREKLAQRQQELGGCER
ncbi:MAG: hypothetical protein AAGF11_03240 [Myxococcota bacterium]